MKQRAPAQDESGVTNAQVIYLTNNSMAFSSPLVRFLTTVTLRRATHIQLWKNL